MVARGQASLIDALGALLVAIALLSAAFLARADFEVELDEVAERESLRREFYRLSASGNMTQLLDLCANQGSLDIGGIRLSSKEPDQGPYVPLLSSREGGITLFYITRKG
ncbi:MAG: hypothetical protein ABC542_01925 [Candidatus Methanosuratincola petrocarbonis]|nr:hypothetical protein [Candidatus Methanosuratincola sp.]